MTLVSPPRHAAAPYRRPPALELASRRAGHPAEPTMPSTNEPTSAPRRDGRLVVVVRSIGIGLGYGLLGVVLLLATVTILVPRLTGAVPLTVLSGSMEPTLPVGSLVVVRPVDAADVRIGDVVTFLPNPDDPTAVTHRVTGITHRADGGRTFTTQGDANDAADLPLQDFQVRARVWYVVHHLGHVNSAVNVDDRHLGVYVVAGGFFVWALRLWHQSWRDRRGSSGGEPVGRHVAQGGAVGHA